MAVHQDGPIREEFVMKRLLAVLLSILFLSCLPFPAHAYTWPEDIPYKFKQYEPLVLEQAGDGAKIETVLPCYDLDISSFSENKDLEASQTLVDYTFITTREGRPGTLVHVPLENPVYYTIRSSETDAFYFVSKKLTEQEGLTPDRLIVPSKPTSFPATYILRASGAGQTRYYLFDGYTQVTETPAVTVLDASGFSALVRAHIPHLDAKREVWHLLAWMFAAVLCVGAGFFFYWYRRRRGRRKGL